MARPRVDAALGALARKRADLSSAHFGLSYRMEPVQPNTASCAPGQDPARPRSEHSPGASRRTGSRAGRLAISAPKRQLRHAVDRNAFKRVAREAWRLADWPAGGDPQNLPPLAMLKLRRSEPEWKTIGRAALKRIWRAELDELLARLLRRLASQGSQSSQPVTGPR